MYTAQQISKIIEGNSVIYTFCVYKNGIVDVKGGEPHQFTFGVPYDALDFNEQVTQYVQYYLKKCRDCESIPLETTPDFDTIGLPEEE